MLRALPTHHASAVTYADVLMPGADEYGGMYAFVFINQLTTYTIIVPVKDKTPVSCALAMLQYALIVASHQEHRLPHDRVMGPAAASAPHKPPFVHDNLRGE